MPIYIRDETANKLIMTIDNNGNLAFADGTPISRLTLGGYGIIDSNGNITHGLSTPSVTCVTGSSSVSYIGSGGTTSVGITTTSGYVPVVQLDADWPADAVTVTPQFDTGGHVTYEVEHTTVWRPAVAVRGLGTGGFTVSTMNSVAGKPAGVTVGGAVPYTSGDFTYRWV